MLAALELSLVAWPCGCIAVFGDLPPRATWHVAYQCKWCDAVFARPDLHQWFAEVDHRPMIIASCRQLLRVGERLVEVTSVCSCGSPHVREARTYGATVEHLDSNFEVARN